jgi:hypothetical protein
MMNDIWYCYDPVNADRTMIWNSATVRKLELSIQVPQALLTTDWKRAGTGRESLSTRGRFPPDRIR